MEKLYDGNDLTHQGRRWNQYSSRFYAFEDCEDCENTNRFPCFCTGTVNHRCAWLPVRWNSAVSDTRRFGQWPMLPQDFGRGRNDRAPPIFWVDGRLYRPHTARKVGGISITCLCLVCTRIDFQSVSKVTSSWKLSSAYNFFHARPPHLKCHELCIDCSSYKYACSENICRLLTNLLSNCLYTLFQISIKAKLPFITSWGSFSA